MSIYQKIYYNLCESKKQLKSSYRRYSGLHKHHIIPKHCGGNDDDSNFTYLTVREHIIAHFLLWKIYRNVNDLRSMKMLGAKLTTIQRIIIGKWCCDNKIGFFSDSIDREIKAEWIRKGIRTQKENEIGIHNPENFKKYASLGGKASIVSPNNPWSYWASKEGQLKRASLGGQAHKNKKCMYKPGDKTFIRVPQESIQKFLDDGYVFGSPIKTNLGKKTNKPSPRRRMVSDGVNTYISVHDAAKKNNITCGAVVHRCKSIKSPWHYVSDI
jgi:hypothetical protein